MTTTANNTMEATYEAKGDMVPGYRKPRNLLSKKSMVFDARSQYIDGLFSEIDHTGSVDTTTMIDIIMSNLDKATKELVPASAGTPPSDGVWYGIYGVDAEEDLHIVKEGHTGKDIQMWHDFARGKARKLKTLMWQGKDELEMHRVGHRLGMFGMMRNAIFGVIPQVCGYGCGCSGRDLAFNAQGAARVKYSDGQTGQTFGLVVSVSGHSESDGDVEIMALALRASGFQQDPFDGIYYHPKYYNQKKQVKK